MNKVSLNNKCFIHLTIILIKAWGCKAPPNDGCEGGPKGPPFLYKWTEFG